MGSNAKAILSVFNLKLILILVETVLVFFLYEKYKININVDYTIMVIENTKGNTMAILIMV